MAIVVLRDPSSGGHSPLSIQSQAEAGERLTEYIMSRGRTGQSHTSSHLTLVSRQDQVEREAPRRFFINWSSERIIFLFLYSLTEEY